MITDNDKVNGWEPATQRVKGRDAPLRGYALMNDYAVLGFIETLYPLPRLQELLDERRLRGMTARELMRDILNAEDYQSHIYDAIVRVYYPEDFA